MGVEGLVRDVEARVVGAIAGTESFSAAEGTATSASLPLIFFPLPLSFPFDEVALPDVPADGASNSTVNTGYRFFLIASLRVSVGVSRSRGLEDTAYDRECRGRAEVDARERVIGRRRGREGRRGDILECGCNDEGGFGLVRRGSATRE